MSASSLHASTANLITFGDSLVDGGNLNLAIQSTGGTGINDLNAGVEPPRSYPDGQFTNGDTWATQLGLIPSLLGGTNFAYGGARAVTNADFIPDLAAQISSFLHSGLSVNDDTTAAIWVGGNDFRDFDPSWTEAEAIQAVGGILGAITDGVKTLFRSGVSSIVVLGLPEFGVLPDVVSVYNSELNSILAGLDDHWPDSNVRYFDINSLYLEVLALVPPELVTVPCIYDPVGCANNPNNYLLYDEIHPSAWVHSILADAIAAEVGMDVTQVPLPASLPLLLFALGGLGLWARRDRSRA